MNIREVYASIGENYDEVLRRLVVETRIVKYVSKFSGDKSFETLEKNLKEKNFPEAFRAVHTLKGIAQNLGFEKLYTASSKLTEKLRSNDYENLDELFSDIEKEYHNVISAIGSVE